jgi:hypothetical protein
MGACNKFYFIAAHFMAMFLYILDNFLCVPFVLIHISLFPLFIDLIYITACTKKFTLKILTLLALFCFYSWRAHFMKASRP